ncbi:MAG TPA: oligosaccharide flippase family protein [Anaerolineales bacterium]|jgi:O-antigen/teichoic acid export membrane protein|nr:oligosaccharide flippase family protein [Anaerolineales bacterium]HQX16025.1 oligosaccharide flippase family protein [Anaerolineales bacterium]
MISRLQRNSLHLLLARITTQALSILFIALLARRLGVADFGQFTFIAAIILLGNTFTNFGADTTLIRELNRAPAPRLIAQSLALQLALSALWVIVTLILKPNSPLLLYSLSLFPLALFSIANAILRARERMDLVLALSLIHGILQLIAAFFSLDISTLILYLLMGHFLTAAFSYLLCNASLPDFNLIPLPNIFPLLKLTLPLAALTFLLVLSQRLGVLTTTLLLGDSATGIFSSVTRIVDGLKLGHYAILGALLPILSRRAPEAAYSFRQGFILLIVVSLLLSIALTVFPHLIISIIYGNEFISATNYLSLFGWSLIPYTVSSFISYHLIAQSRETLLVKATAVSLAACLALSLWLIPIFQVQGAIYAALVGEIIQAIIFLIASRPSTFNLRP